MVTRSEHAVQDMYPDCKAWHKVNGNYVCAQDGKAPPAATASSAVPKASQERDVASASPSAGTEADTLVEPKEDADASHATPTKVHRRVGSHKVVTSTLIDSDATVDASLSKWKHPEQMSEAALLRNEKEDAEMSTAGEAPTDSDWRAANADMLLTADASQHVDVATGLKVSEMPSRKSIREDVGNVDKTPLTEEKSDALEQVPEETTSSLEQAAATVQERAHTQARNRMNKRVNAWLAWKALVTKHGRGNTKAMKEKQAKGDEKMQKEAFACIKKDCAGAMGKNPKTYAGEMCAKAKAKESATKKQIADEKKQKKIKHDRKERALKDKEKATELKAKKAEKKWKATTPACVDCHAKCAKTMVPGVTVLSMNVWRGKTTAADDAELKRLLAKKGEMALLQQQPALVKSKSHVPAGSVKKGSWHTWNRPTFPLGYKLLPKKVEAAAERIFPVKSYSTVSMGYTRLVKPSKMPMGLTSPDKKGKLSGSANNQAEIFADKINKKRPTTMKALLKLLHVNVHDSDMKKVLSNVLSKMGWKESAIAAATLFHVRATAGAMKRSVDVHAAIVAAHAKKGQPQLYHMKLHVRDIINPTQADAERLCKKGSVGTGVPGYRYRALLKMDASIKTKFTPFNSLKGDVHTNVFYKDDDNFDVKGKVTATTGGITHGNTVVSVNGMIFNFGEDLARKGVKNRRYSKLSGLSHMSLPLFSAPIKASKLSIGVSPFKLQFAGIATVGKGRFVDVSTTGSLDANKKVVFKTTMTVGVANLDLSKLTALHKKMCKTAVRNLPILLPRTRMVWDSAVSRLKISRSNCYLAKAISAEGHFNSPKPVQTTVYGHIDLPHKGYSFKLTFRGVNAGPYLAMKVKETQILSFTGKSSKISLSGDAKTCGNMLLSGTGEVKLPSVKTVRIPVYFKVDNNLGKMRILAYGGAKLGGKQITAFVNIYGKDSMVAFGFPQGVTMASFPLLANVQGVSKFNALSAGATIAAFQVNGESKARFSGYGKVGITDFTFLKGSAKVAMKSMLDQITLSKSTSGVAISGQTAGKPFSASLARVGFLKKMATQRGSARVYGFVNLATRSMNMRASVRGHMHFRNAVGTFTSKVMAINLVSNAAGKLSVSLAGTGGLVIANVAMGPMTKTGVPMRFVASTTGGKTGTFVLKARGVGMIRGKRAAIGYRYSKMRGMHSKSSAAFRIPYVRIRELVKRKRADLRTFKDAKVVFSNHDTKNFKAGLTVIGEVVRIGGADVMKHLKRAFRLNVNGLAKTVAWYPIIGMGSSAMSRKGYAVRSSITP
jgi:hypothetical protein